MLLPRTLDAFVAASPVSVMVRGTLERIFDAQALQGLFENHAQRQYTRKLTFFQCVQVMSDVVFKTVPSVSAWYQSFADELTATRTALYEKLNHMEPPVCSALVGHSARVLAPVLQQLKNLPPPRLDGYRVRVLDGNHLGGTQHRLAELRPLRAAGLPAEVLALYDPQLDLILEVVCGEDAYAQERTLMRRMLRQTAAGDCLLIDRNFCTAGFLVALARRRAGFVVREHATLKPQELAPRRSGGKDAQGRRLYEQAVEVTDAASGQTLRLRRITLHLRKPTQDGETEIRLLTNLPAEVADAATVAALYAGRWTIEDAFGHLAVDLRCEIDTLGYPRAALLGFCVAVVAYNAVSMVKGAVRAAWGEQVVAEELSMHYLTLEVARTSEGMEIATGEESWAVFGRMSDPDFGQTMVQLAGRMQLSRYAKHKRGPKRPPPQKISGKHRHHFSTFRLIAQRKRCIP